MSGNDKGDPQGRARPPGGPLGGTRLPERVNLNHTPPGWVKSGSVFFVTIACAVRGRNQLCHPLIGAALLDAVRYYHERHDWFVHLFLLMPDHAHALVATAPDKPLAMVVGNWKRYATTKHGVSWQKNFIDHRLRSDESWEEKAVYIRTNPVRAGLCREGESWPYLFEV